MVQFLLKLLLKQRILAMYHDFHWLLVAQKLLTTNFIHITLKSWKFWKGQSWSLTLYLQLGIHFIYFEIECHFWMVGRLHPRFQNTSQYSATAGSLRFHTKVSSSQVGDVIIPAASWLVLGHFPGDVAAQFASLCFTTELEILSKTSESLAEATFGINRN